MRYLPTRTRTFIVVASYLAPPHAAFCFCLITRSLLCCQRRLMRCASVSETTSSSSRAASTTGFYVRKYSRYPRAYARGTWDLKPEIQLYFARVDFLLKLNISFDDVFVDPDRGGEKTDGQKFIPPVYLLDPGKTLANFPTRVGFDLANDLGHGILGGNHDHQMNMIDLDAQRLDFNVRMKRLNVE